MRLRRFARSSSGRPEMTTHGYRSEMRASRLRVSARIRAAAGVAAIGASVPS